MIVYALLCYCLLLTLALAWVIWPLRNRIKREAEKEVADSVRPFVEKTEMMCADIGRIEGIVYSIVNGTVAIKRKTDEAYNNYDDMSTAVEVLEESLRELQATVKEQQRRISELKSSFDEVIADELDARAKSEKLFADGLESILNYGGEIPTLNKENVRNDR